MLLRRVYLQMVSVKQMIHVLLTNDPSLRSTYKLLKRQMEEELEEKDERINKVMTEDAIARSVRHASIRLSPDEVSENLLRVIRQVSALPDEDLMDYNDYGLGVLRTIARDLIIMKRILNYSQEIDYSRFAGEVTKDIFRRASGAVNHRFQYEAYFPNEKNANGERRYDRGLGVYKAGGYYGNWQVPISRTWFRTVAMRGLATTDIAGKQVMTVNARKSQEQPAKPEEEIVVYKATVAFAKKEARGTMKNRTYYLHPDECMPLNLIEDNDIPQAALDAFNLSYGPYGIGVSKGSEMPSGVKTTRHVGYPERWYVYHCSALQKQPFSTSSSLISVEAPGWQTDTIGYLQERYIAVYQPKGSSKRKIASGTSPLRSVSVLRNRLKDEVLDEIGVLF